MTGTPPSCDAEKRGGIRHLLTLAEVVDETSSVILLEIVYLVLQRVHLAPHIVV